MEKESELLQKNLEHLAAGLSASWKALVKYAETDGAETKARIKEELSKQLDGLLQEMKPTYTKGKKLVEENPWKSAMLAFGIGFLLGKLTERGKK